MKWFGTTLFLFFLSALSGIAHIGAPTVFYQGNAGPYPVQITIRPPGVVPGLAEVSVQVVNASEVEVLPVHSSTGRKGSPPPDKAARVRGQTDRFSASLWLMETGAYSVLVTVKGDRGTGEAVVPVNSIAEKRLEMPMAMGTILLLLGLLLLVGGGSVAFTAFKESHLAPNETPTQRDARRGCIAGTLSILLLGFGAYGGKQWWESVDRDYRNNRMYKSIPLGVTLPEGNTRELVMEIRKEDPRQRAEIIPDHGKMMHLFLVEEGTANSFAHLHPLMTAPGLFRTHLPSDLQAGDYWVYADITEEDGLTHTLTNRIRIPEFKAIEETDMDPDDSWLVLRDNSPGKPGRENGFLLGEHRMEMEGPAVLKAKEPVSLQFSAWNNQKEPIRLEPYMGMGGHLVVRHQDGSVFAHIHPIGTFSMASQKLFGESAEEELPAHGHKPQASNRLSFPFEFPKAGSYRLWLQAKSSGRILSAVFDISVQ